MTVKQAIGTAVDLAAMAGVAVLIWFGWNPLLRYLPGRLADDVNAVLGWIGVEADARGWLRWVAEVEWLVGVLLIVALFWVAEKLVALVRSRLGVAG